MQYRLRKEILKSSQLAFINIQRGSEDATETKAGATELLLKSALVVCIV